MRARKPRVIPCLLLDRGRLVKTVSFSKPGYVGDPINVVKIFNEKEADELILLDISASRRRDPPAFEMIEQVAAECFMPMTYGGGVATVEQAERIISMGVEKVVVNSAVFRGTALIANMARRLGSSSTVVGIDVKQDRRGRYRVYDAARKKLTELDPANHAKQVVDAGAGEIFLNDVERDGRGIGFDLDLIREVSGAVDVPVIACGGAGRLADLRLATDAGAAAVAAGSMFVYLGKQRAVMINYPAYRTQVELFQ